MSRWHRNYEFEANKYSHFKEVYTPIKFKPYAQTITEYELQNSTDQIGLLATRFNELVNHYNHLLDIQNIEEPFVY